MPMPSGSLPASGPFAKAVSAEVRAALARKRMTAKELARRAEISESYLGKRLRETASFTLNDVECICEALNEELLPFITAAIQGAEDGGKP